MNFTIENYERMLRSSLKNGYKFISFEEAHLINNSEDSHLYCVLRHDIDADPGRAFQMAFIEHKLSIKSTFFFMLRSPIYNLFSRENHTYMQKIINLGHYVGLHFDGNFVPEPFNHKTLLEKELCILEQTISKKISVISLHQPTPESIKETILMNGIINTYSKDQLGTFHYISDSNMNWKDKAPFQIFEEKKVKRLHLLIHPLWWFSDGCANTETIWDEVILDSFHRMQRQLIETERAYGPKRNLTIDRK